MHKVNLTYDAIKMASTQTSKFGAVACTSALWLLLVLLMPSQDSQVMGRALSDRDIMFTDQVFFDISEGGKLLGRVTFGLYGHVVRAYNFSLQVAE